MEELEKEYRDLKNEEQDLWRNLKRHKDEDLQKGQAVKNQRALWDKTLEFRFLLQKPFSSSNRLPQEPIRSLFCDTDSEVSEAYSDLVASSKKTLDCIMELQQKFEAGNSNGDVDEEWLQISQMQSRMASFRNKSIDKWQRKTQVTTGAAAIKDKLHAFNQEPDSTENIKQEETYANGDPELLDDSDFYQQLLKEFFETIDPSSSETAFCALKRLQTKKRKIVDRRASKSRKIRYNVHEKIVNFMAPRPTDVPPMASKLFENFIVLVKTYDLTVARLICWDCFHPPLMVTVTITNSLTLEHDSINDEELKKPESRFVVDEVLGRDGKLVKFLAHLKEDEF
ncbi:hypothetical protein DH2020_023518 [Rehmannia glutinosa]|uniref:Protein AATF n=1 Tax=Rehmannia glutinosa TaxID=99300 RepID=A0ABR0WAF7_REHGL